MKAIVTTAFGSPETLEMTEQPSPQAGPGQVLVAVEAAGVGLADVFLRRGFMPHVDLGFTPGLEMAGTVVAVGAGVDEIWVDKRIFAMVREGRQSGCYAELVVAELDKVVELPTQVSSVQAVALGINALVAEFVIRRARLQAGEQVLVRGAGGGIGVMAVQLAAHHGATVTASSSSSERAARLRELGATHLVDRAGRAVDGAVPDYFDVILDPVAGPDVLRFADRLRANGRVVFAGIAAGPPPPELATAIVDARSLSFSLLSLDAVSDTERRPALRDIFAMATRGELTPVIDQTLDLARAADAQTALETGTTFGKVVLTITRHESLLPS